MVLINTRVIIREGSRWALLVVLWTLSTVEFGEMSELISGLTFLCTLFFKNKKQFSS